MDCVELLLKKGSDPNYLWPGKYSPLQGAVHRADLQITRLLIAYGADIQSKDEGGYTPLMMGALSYFQNKEIVAELLSRGADSKPKNQDSDTALSLARRYGDTPIVRLLQQYGAPERDAQPTPALPRAENRTLREAIDRSIQLLQPAGPPVFKTRGCTSCHHNSLPAWAVSLARRRGFAVDEKIATLEMKTAAADTRGTRQTALLGSGIAASSAYILFGMSAGNQLPTDSSDARNSSTRVQAE